jgi:hypothetical protein
MELVMLQWNKEQLAASYLEYSNMVVREVD